MPTSTSRLLLLLPTTTYRTQAFIDAATRLGVDLVCASERPSTLEDLAPDSLVTLDFRDPRSSAETIARFARRRPIDAVVAVDDLTTVVGAAISARLGLKANSLPAVSAARDKHAMRRCLAGAGVPVPRFRREQYVTSVPVPQGQRIALRSVAGDHARLPLPIFDRLDMHTSPLS